MNKKKFTDEQIKKIIEDYVTNIIPVVTIAKNLNVDGSVIKRILNENNIIVINGSAFSDKYWIKRGLTKEDSLLKTKEFKPCCVEYWVKRGYSVESAKKQIESHLMNTEQTYIDKYGEIDGKIKYKEKKYKDGVLNSPRKITYWLNKGYSENESKILLSNSQSTFSLEKCIKKYGKENGIEIFTNRQLKWQKSLNENGNMKMGFSKISQELFYDILVEYNINEKKDIYFATHNGEYKMQKESSGLWLYDFTDLKNKKIIEYNGDMYHANPKKYLPNDTPHPYNKTILSIDIWEKDKEKIETAKKNGFEILTIWDSEYRWSNKKKVLLKCLKFLMNNK